MKKIINDPSNVVSDMIQGIVLAHPNYVRKSENGDILVRKDAPVEGKVGLVSGGGSGHEPSHGGFVGYGMLDAAVCGEVFTSPTPDQVYEAIKEVNGGNGVLLVIKNYTGDVMNFEMAKEMAEMDGIEVDYVVVNDDVAVENSLYTAGRRGIAGTVFVHKIAGAKATKGATLSEVKEVANKVIANVRSMGMALSPCTVPAAGKPNFILETHKEEISTANNITTHLVDKILADLEIVEGEEVAVMVNGLGSTPLMELYIANKTVNEILTKKGIKIYNTFVGEYMTSLEMAGYSVSILRLDEELKELLDAKANTLGLKVL